MKKILIIPLLLIGMSMTAFAYQVKDQGSALFSNDCMGGYAFNVGIDKVNPMFSTSACGDPINGGSSLPIGQYYFLYYDFSNTIIATEGFCIHNWYDPPCTEPATYSIETMLENATSSFMSMLGFTPAEAVGNVGSLFIMPIIGGGIMLLSELKWWIIALIMLSAFIYFAYRAFKFYRH